MGFSYFHIFSMHWIHLWHIRSDWINLHTIADVLMHITIIFVFNLYTYNIYDCKRRLFNFIYVHMLMLSLLWTFQVIFKECSTTFWRSSSVIEYYLVKLFPLAGTTLSQWVASSYLVVEIPCTFYSHLVFAIIPK